MPTYAATANKAAAAVAAPNQTVRRGADRGGGIGSVVASFGRLSVNTVPGDSVSTSGTGTWSTDINVGALSGGISSAARSARSNRAARCELS